MEIIGQKQAPAPEFKLHVWQADDQLEINDLAFRYHAGGKIAPLVSMTCWLTYQRA